MKAAVLTLLFYDFQVNNSKRGMLMIPTLS
jgi:hypothetical protein